MFNATIIESIYMGAVLGDCMGENPLQGFLDE